MKELVTYLAKALVDHPDQVEVDSGSEADHLVLTLKVAEEDKGKVIGKQGRVVKAMRALLDASAEKDGKRVRLDVA